MYLFHGTTLESGKLIEKQGFIPDKKYNWKIKSKKGFVYLSSAYAPFYAMTAKSKSKIRALVKVEVNTEYLYPDDDFIMFALKKPKYTQRELNKINLEDYKDLWVHSLNYLGNVSTKPENIKIIGITYFDASKLILVCDPIISPMNYKFMGNYYRSLTEYIYNGNKPENFKGLDFL